MPGFSASAAPATIFIIIIQQLHFAVKQNFLIVSKNFLIVPLPPTKLPAKGNTAGALMFPGLKTSAGYHSGSL